MPTFQQNWQQLYHEAVLETDAERIQERIAAVESAIKKRLHDFSMDHGGTPEENRAIEDALRALDILRKETSEWRESKRAG